MGISPDRQKAVETAMTQIERQFGKGAIMKLGDSPVASVAVIPTGSLALDVALGVGGVPRGRVIEIFGPEASGKTTLALHILAEAQRLGGIVAFVDAEHAMDPSYAKKLGVDTVNLLVSQPDSGEQALEIVETLVRSGALDVIVIDSVAALVPRAEIEGEMGYSHMGLQARLMSQALRKLTATVSKSNTCVIFINQVREKIGDHSCYFTYDIDSLDPAFAPGTGTVEMGGLTTWQALEIVRGAKGLNLIGGDLEEVSPPYDPSGNTALIGANILYEMLCVLPGVKYSQS